jgi:hypothetical protein
MKALDNVKKKIISQLYEKSQLELWKTFCNLTEEDRKDTIYNLLKAFYGKYIDMEENKDYYWTVFSYLPQDMQKDYIISFGYRYDMILSGTN